MKVYVDFINQNAKSTITPVVFTNLVENEKIVIEKTGGVSTGDENVISIKQA